jgi:excisionase family DNA binding protein
VEEINMRTRLLSAANDLAPSSSGHARTGRRATADIPTFFTISQVAELAGVSTRSVRRWIDAGLLVAHRFGGVVRIADHDLRAFLNQHRSD